MLDPVLICLFLPKQLHWLTRADVFKKPVINFLLRKFNMLPVYRERDRVPQLRALNNQTFDEAYARLSLNSVVCVFPEGTHRGKKQLHSLKKGIVRMSTSIVEKNMHNAVILPVGLEYEDFYSYRKDIMIKIGKPIELSNYKIDLEKDQARTQNILLYDIRIALKSVMIDIEKEDLYNTLAHLRDLSYEASYSQNAEQQFDHYQTICQLPNTSEKFAQTLGLTGKEYVRLSGELNLTDAFYSAKKPIKQIILSIILALPSLPGIVFFYPVYLFTEWAQQKIVKDPLFINSIRVVFWTFVTLIWIMLLLLIMQLIVRNLMLSLLLVVSTILSGIIALHWSEYRKCGLAWKHRQIVKNKISVKYQKWTLLRAELLEILSLKNYR